MRLFRQAALLTYNIDPRPEAHKESLALLESTHDKVTKHFRRSYLDAQRELHAQRAPQRAVRSIRRSDASQIVRLALSMCQGDEAKVCSEGLDE